MANFVQSSAYTNLSAATINIPTTDLYNFNVTVTLPNADQTATQGPGGGAGTGTSVAAFVSQVVITVRQNGTIIYTSHISSRGFTLNAVSCTAGDVITITPSSSSPQDQAPQAVKMTVAVSEGPL